MEYEVCLIESRELQGDVKSFRFTRPSDYSFAAGQFASLRLYEGGKRTFSFSNSPTEEGYLQFTTRMSGSDYKNALGRLRPGDGAFLSQAAGRFVHDPAVEKAAFLSGGIGITPIRSICRFLADTNSPGRRLLIYGNRDETCIPFIEDFEEMAARDGGLRMVLVLERPVGEWSGHTGFITKDIIAAEIPDFPDWTFYICGPPIMVQVMEKLLGELQVERQRIRIESFAGY
jgi:ferredoxin-NADP reductase